MGKVKSHAAIKLLKEVRKLDKILKRTSLPDYKRELLEIKIELLLAYIYELSGESLN